MADGVDIAMKGVEPAGPNPMIDRSPAEPQGIKLSPRHNPMLALGQLGHQLVYMASV
jgi:hypothetical protein